MKIEFWLDYLCPTCYLQHQTIESMLKHYDIHDLELIYRSYEMVEDRAFDTNQSYVSFIAKHQKMSEEAVEKFLNEYNYHIQLFRIHDVHRMAHLAKKKQISRKFNQVVFHAIYEDKLDLSDHKHLKDVSIKAGLEETDIDEVLSTDKFSNQVISNRENAQLKGIYELPFLRINGQTKLQGLQLEQDLVNTLNQSFIKFKDVEFCEGEHCIRKKRK